MHKKSILTRILLILILVGFIVSIVGINNIVNGSRAEAENVKPAASFLDDKSIPLSEEDILKKAEKIVLELERSMPTIRGIPKSIWSEEENKSVQVGTWKEVPNQEIMSALYEQFEVLPTQDQPEIIRKHLERLPGFFYDSIIGGYRSKDTGVWYVIRDGKRVVPKEEYYDTNSIYLSPELFYIEYRPVEYYTVDHYKNVEVKEGDTLIRIAHRYYPLDSRLDEKSYLDEIAKINSIQDANSIKTGDILHIPVYKQNN